MFCMKLARNQSLQFADTPNYQIGWMYIYIYISHYVSSRIYPMISHVLFLNPHYSPIFCRFFPRANPPRYRGSIQLNEFKAVMLAALRSLVSRSRGGLRWAPGCGSWRLALTVQNISYHLFIYIYNITIYIYTYQIWFRHINGSWLEFNELRSLQNNSWR